MKRKLTVNILIYTIILMIPIHSFAEPKITPQPTEQMQDSILQQESAPTEMPAPEPETQDPNISYAAPGEPPEIDYSMLDYYNNNCNTLLKGSDSEVIGESVGNTEVSDNTPSIYEWEGDTFEPTTFDSPYYSANNQNENIILNEGALSISNTILSIPGKNGFDLNISLNYNSESAVIDSPLYYFPGSTRYNENYYKFKVASQNCFYAPGWELSNSYISWNDTEDLYTNGKNASTLHMSDGRSYQIKYHQNRYTLVGCSTEDLKLTEDYNADTNEAEYTLSYKDGQTEVFDWRGCLIRKSDRYNNTINYFYEEENLHRINYMTYASSPAAYSRTFPALYKIQYNVDRFIYIEREVQADALGNCMKAVHFKMDGATLASVNFTQLETAYGPVSSISSIEIFSLDNDTQNVISTLTYTYQYQELISAKTYDTSFNPCANSKIAMTQIIYPTGAQANYTYDIYKENTYDGLAFGYNETYKIASRWDMIDGEESGRKIYKYINNSSGYPYTYKASDGQISADFCYYTLVSEALSDTGNNKNTLYTFDKKHLKINEEAYLDSPDNGQKILPLKGAADKSHYAYISSTRKIYRCIQPAHNWSLNESTVKIMRQTMKWKSLFLLEIYLLKRKPTLSVRYIQ